MDNSFSKKQLGLAVTCALALSFASGAAQAQTRGVPIDDRQVWVDQGKTQVWMNGFGECWHSAYGPPPGYGPCNPAPLAQYVPPPAPAPVAAPPPPAPVQQAAPAPAPVVIPPELPRKKDRN